jgi:hypothetical protein
MLTQWYQRCSRYYTVAATEEEKRLTMMLFQKIFDALASRVCRNRVLIRIEELDFESINDKQCRSSNNRNPKENEQHILHKINMMKVILKREAASV